jgi:AbrB family looped-hinge helix DNA binding protein
MTAFPYPAAEVKLSAKGQVVIPKKIRAALGLKPGDRLTFELTKDKTAVLRSQSEPPPDVFVHAGSRAIDKIFRESDRIDEARIERLLKDLGVK